MIYLYQCPKHGEFEAEHSVNDKLEICSKCIEEKLDNPQKVKRLIAGGTHFTLIGGGWAKDLYK